MLQFCSKATVEADHENRQRGDLIYFNVLQEKYFTASKKKSYFLNPYIKRDRGWRNSGTLGCPKAVQLRGEQHSKVSTGPRKTMGGGGWTELTKPPEEQMTEVNLKNMCTEDQVADLQIWERDARG